MLSKEILEFEEARYPLRAYLCFLFTRNIPNRLPEPDIEMVVAGLKKIRKEVEIFDALYVLDNQGRQIRNNISPIPEFRVGDGVSRAHRAYFYRACREKKCILTDPYPSMTNGEITVTAAYPIYNQKNELKFVACIDIRLEHALKIAKPTTIDSIFSNFSKLTYLVLSFTLFIIAIMLFIKSLISMTFAATHFTSLEIKDMFEATILLTLSLAIFDLVKAIFEEEVLGKHKKDNSSFQIHKTMIRFLGSIIIAISIEALMLVFKFTIIEPDKIIYAVYLIGGVTLLLFGLAFYIKQANSVDKETQ